MKKYFNTNDISEMCQVSKGSVVRWIKENKLKAANTAGGHHRVWVDDLIAFLRSLNMVIPKDLQVLSAPGAQKVLIVEDDVNLLNLLKTFFKNTFPGLEIHEAKTGFEAGLAISKFQPNLIILDLMLPGMDGFQVCERIRSQAEWNTIKIIVMTGLQSPEVKDRVLRLGADDFLTKPFDLDILKNKILQHLRPFEGVVSESERGLK